jgi:hypothetical protein
VINGIFRRVPKRVFNVGGRLTAKVGNLRAAARRFSRYSPKLCNVLFDRLRVELVPQHVPLFAGCCSEAIYLLQISLRCA